MTEDKFLQFINDYSSKGKGADKANSRRDTRGALLILWLIGLLVSIVVHAFFVFWLPYTLFLLFYGLRENTF